MQTSFSKRPNCWASNVATTLPFAPGAIGSLVQSATVQAQDVMTLFITKGLSPVFVIVYSTFTGCFHSIRFRFTLSVLDEIRGWAKTDVAASNMLYNKIFFKFIYPFVYSAKLEKTIQLKEANWLIGVNY